MATLTSPQLNLPGTMLGVVTDNSIQSGILPKLVPSKPTLFGPVRGATFSGIPRAQIVGEGEAKSGQDVGLEPFSAEPVKAQITVRVSEEFKWADDDYRLGVLNDLVAPAIGQGMGRFVDLFAFHGINPLAGTRSTKATKALVDTTNKVAASGKPTSELTAAVGLVAGAGNGLPTGIALDAAYSFALTTEVFPAGHPMAGMPINPNATFAQTDSWRGITAAASSTVSGRPEIADSKVRAFVGDFTQVRWGYQKQIPLELIEYGNPDNVMTDGKPRDLKGFNEIALRAEVVIYMAIGNLNRFAKVVEG